MTINTAGIRDPDDPGRWLVRPWPVDAGFGAVVRHFVAAYAGRLLGDEGVARQLAYFEAYQAALLAASTDELQHPVARGWRDELLDCVARCVATYRAAQAGQRAADANVRRLPPTVPTNQPQRQAS